MSILSSLFHKSFRLIQNEPFLESLMIILGAFLNYFICELEFLNLSGIVAIFVYGILQSHYNRYNLSKEAQNKTESILDM